MEALVKAIAWADANYGKREWIRDPFGNYQDKKVLDIVWALVRQSEQEQKANEQVREVGN